jgi:tRNA G46 methylase TrmB
MTTGNEPDQLPQGYVLDASYADTFFQELSPAWLNYSRALNGVPAKPLDRPFTYLELGAGFGNSTVVNAGAFPHGEFHACDFNPAHIAGGRAYAETLGLRNIRFHETSFQQLLAIDLPKFDFIVLRRSTAGWVPRREPPFARSFSRAWARAGSFT